MIHGGLWCTRVWALSFRIVRIQTIYVTCMRADDHGMVTMTATKTIVREHEADLVVRRAEIVADGVVALTLADSTGVRCRRGRRARTST